MKAPMFLRALSPVEQAGIEAGWRSSDAFPLRRRQILLASHRGQRPSDIARNLGCAVHTVRNTLHAFDRDGLLCVKRQSSRPKTSRTEWDQPRCEAVRAMLHQRPRADGKPTSVWTVALAAQVCQERGVTEHHVSIETIRLALTRLKVGWHPPDRDWITSPDPEDARKKRRDALIDLAHRCGWMVGYLDEVWWSRVAQPKMHSWSDAGEPLRVLERQISTEDPDPKALSCYGMLDPDRQAIWLRVVDGRPVSHVTTAFLEWLCQEVLSQGRRVLVLIWDNVSWHVSKEVRLWIQQHNRGVLTVERENHPGVRIIPCWLPTTSPWLNRIEPHWMHGNKAIVEPARLLTAHELENRVCGSFGSPMVDHLAHEVS